MTYWGGATGHEKMCACGLTDSCFYGRDCNCFNGGGWRQDSGLLTDKSVLPVTQMRFGDLDNPREEGFYTLGKLLNVIAKREIILSHDQRFGKVMDKAK